MAINCIPKEVIDKFINKLNAKKMASMSEVEKQQILNNEFGKDLGSKVYKSLNTIFRNNELSDIESQKILDLGKTANKAYQDVLQDPTNKAKQIDYGKKYLDYTEYANSLKPKGKLLTFANIVNLPKSALVSVFHFSASFVQGWGSITRGAFWEGFKNQFKYYASADAYREGRAAIIGHPDYELSQKAGLGLTMLGDKLSSREEAIQSSLLEHVPGLNKIVNASSRAFTGMLNDIRFSRFTDLIEAARMKEEDVSMGSKVTKDIANVVNNFTGRGNLPGNLNKITPELNALWFSPRKIAATIQMFNPLNFLDPRISPTARVEALRNLSGSVIATAAVLTLAQTMGASVNLNPTSTNFLKIKIGNTTLDMTGGNSIYVRLWARLITNSKTTSAGNTSTLGVGYKPETRADLILEFLRDKLAPTASAIADALYGSDPIGRPFSVSQEAQDKLIPITIQNFIELANNDPKNTAVILPSLFSIFGVEMQSPEPTTMYDWQQSTAKSAVEFKTKVGDAKFSQANTKYVQMYDDWFKQVQNNPRYKNLTPDQQATERADKKEAIKTQIMLQFGYRYKKAPSKPLPKL